MSATLVTLTVARTSDPVRINDGFHMEIEIARPFEPPALAYILISPACIGGTITHNGATFDLLASDCLLLTLSAKHQRRAINAIRQ